MMPPMSLHHPVFCTCVALALEMVPFGAFLGQGQVYHAPLVNSLPRPPIQWRQWEMLLCHNVPPTLA